MIFIAVHVFSLDDKSIKLYFPKPQSVNNFTAIYVILDNRYLSSKARPEIHIEYCA